MRKIFWILGGLAAFAILCMILYPEYERRSYQEKAKAAINAKLIDPTSALFSEFTERQTIPEVPDDSIIRVKVNAKNSFGGYIGNRQWVIIFHHSKFFIDEAKRVEAEVEDERFDRLYNKFEKHAKAANDKFKAAPMSTDVVLDVLGVKDTAKQLALMGYSKYLETSEDIHARWLRRSEQDKDWFEKNKP